MDHPGQAREEHAHSSPPGDPSPSEAKPGSRAERVARAIHEWRNQLVDLGGNNTLLHYKDRLRATLDLGDKQTCLWDQVQLLLLGKPVRLSNLFANQSALEDAARRCRVIAAKARENFEERGLDTLYLVFQMASWKDTRDAPFPPVAPIFLRPLVLRPRGGSAEDFDLVPEGPFELNPTLRQTLELEFKLTLPTDEQLKLDPEAGPGQLPYRALRELHRQAADVPGFQVIDRVVVGNFSYAKLPMVRDLENASTAFAAHDVIAALANDAVALHELREHQGSFTPTPPDEVPPQDEYLVLDADASQSAVIDLALQGSHLVVEGPPGTGKSQTIANLIAALAARGKTALFVAEKRAAIDAVLRRLEGVELNDLVLDLHSRDGSRKQLAQDLARSLDTVRAARRPQVEKNQAALQRSRTHLSAYDRELHRIRQPWGMSVYQLQAELVAGAPPGASSLRLGRQALDQLHGVALQEVVDDLHRYLELGGVRIAGFRDPWSNALAAETIAARGTVERAQELLSDLLNQFGRPLVRDLRRAATQLGLSPGSTTDEWRHRLEVASRVAETASSLGNAVLGAPLDQLLTDLEPAGHGWLAEVSARVFDSGYRAAKRTAEGLLPGGRALSGAHLAEQLRSVNALLAEWRKVADGGAPPPTVAQVGDLRKRLEAADQAIHELAVLAGQPNLAAIPVGGWENPVRALFDARESMAALPDLLALRCSLAARGLTSLLESLQEQQLSWKEVYVHFRYVWAASLLERITGDDRVISRFSGKVHSGHQDEFCSSDREHIRSGPERVWRRVAEQTVTARERYPEESQLILNQARRKRGHLPVRELFTRAPHVLTALKPCWAMSPLLVAELLPAQTLFDVVIFDEASQVPPADAVGAILRGRQVVVAGDSKQLPPTAFFQVSADPDETGDQDSDAAVSGPLTQSLESVLDVMATVLPAPRGTQTLLWHYRSLDERLITFSNLHPQLYNGRLTTFPGVSADDSLHFELVPFRLGRLGQEDSVSDEVNRVVELILEHAKSRPGESLGVIALGIKHSNRIEETLRLRRRASPELDPWFDGGPDGSGLERFFVKNLERVQGDERDAIILAVGYGKSADGRMLYRFGPVNQEGGERRLNVAVTRARRRMTLVSSFTAVDMDPAHLRSQGAQVLQAYLRYIASRGAEMGVATAYHPTPNAFELDVERRLRDRGLKLIPQYGASGYYLDFAVQHPTQPGRMVLAIECDGAAYHSAQSARDRDRFRQEHLERLGWTFHRIWSREWMRDPERVVEEVLRSYRRALRAIDGAYQDRRPSVPPVSRPLRVVPKRGPRPIPTGMGWPITDYTNNELVQLIDWIKADTLPRTEDELVNEAASYLGFQRLGSRIREALRSAIRTAGGADHIHRSGSI